MNNSIIRINGTGCALADFFYTNVKFNDPKFLKYLSKNVGDGGLSPGKLVFTEELVQFSNKPYNEILKDLTGNDSPDSFNIGGPSLVSLINASQLLSSSEFEVNFYGNAGNDHIAKRIFDTVQKTPLNISNYEKLSNRETAFTDVFSDFTYDEGQGERTFVNNIGAAWDYTPEMLSTDFFDAQIVCFGGTALVPQIHDSLTDLLNEAKKNHCITVVNTVFDFRNEKNAPGKPWPLGNTRESLKLIDVLIMDLEEALKISAQKTIDDAARYFEQQHVSSFIITCGSKDSIVYSNGSLFRKLAITRFPVSQLVLDELKNNECLRGDTTGCGDNFVGGIIASLAMQLKSKDIGKFDLPVAISWATASGGFSCYYVGGAFLEKFVGEKLERISKHQIEYLKQIQYR
jgi:sugar/nucleoside kinase (ribokinase family)